MCVRFFILAKLDNAYFWLILQLTAAAAILQNWMCVYSFPGVVKHQGVCQPYICINIYKSPKSSSINLFLETKIKLKNCYKI